MRSYCLSTISAPKVLTNKHFLAMRGSLDPYIYKFCVDGGEFRIAAATVEVADLEATTKIQKKAKPQHKHKTCTNGQGSDYYTSSEFDLLTGRVFVYLMLV